MTEQLRHKSLVDIGQEVEITELAENLETSYNISNRLGLNGWQAKLFKYSLMGYLSRQTDPECEDLLKRPEIESMVKVPIFRGIVSLIQKTVDVQTRFTQECFDKAADIEDEITEFAKNEVLIFLARQMDSPLEKVKEEFPPDDPGLLRNTDVLLRKVGSPGAIKRAANLISSTYINYKTHDTVELRIAIESTIARIKIKEDPEIER